jgi:hypothetical protein
MTGITVFSAGAVERPLEAGLAVRDFAGVTPGGDTDRALRFGA